jgi:hypothetical protein
MAIFRVTVALINVKQDPPSIGLIRAENIDTNTNKVYSDCSTLREVEARYEEFWNYLNFDDVPHNDLERIKVLKIERLSGEEPSTKPSPVKVLMIGARCTS